MAPSEKDRRAAALAAAEARLKGSPSPAELEEAANAPKVEQWKQPSEKDDIEAKRALARLIDRGIVRDNGYRQSADAVETLLKIANNILQNPEEKYRKLKSTNKMLKEKVLDARGGHEYLIAMGFRTQTIDFTLTYVLIPSLRRMHELRLGADVLESHLPALRARVAGQNASTVNHKAEEAQRVARALREIDEDRDLVKARIERERIVREAREKAQREDEAKKKRQEQEQEEYEYNDLDLALGRGGHTAEYTTAPQSDLRAGSSSGGRGAQRLDGRAVDEDDEEMEGGEEQNDEDSEEDDDEDRDGSPNAGHSLNNGNSVQLQGPNQPTGPPDPHPQGGAYSRRGNPRSRHAGSGTDDRRNVISSTLRRGGPRAAPQAFGGSGNVLGGQAVANPANEGEEDMEDEDQDEDAELLRPLHDDEDAGRNTGGGRVLGSA